MKTAIRYQNSILGDCLDIMTTDDLLEFAVETDWMRSYLGDSGWLLVKNALGRHMHLPWREGLAAALEDAFPGQENVCLPQQS
jgi:hypothetical protein